MPGRTATSRKCRCAIKIPEVGIAPANVLGPNGGWHLQDTSRARYDEVQILCQIKDNCKE